MQHLPPTHGKKDADQAVNGVQNRSANCIGMAADKSVRSNEHQADHSRHRGPAYVHLSVRLFTSQQKPFGNRRENKKQSGQGGAALGAGGKA